MKLSLEQINSIQDLANCLYSFLPGNPHPYADQKISFEGISRDLNLTQFWTKGSKTPAIANLLEKTLEYERGKFSRLIVDIIKRGMKYRTKQRNPITKEEIERINYLILKFEFKIPELWDKKYLDSLPSQKKEKNSLKTTETKLYQSKRDELIKELMNLESIESKQGRGYAFEKFLIKLFDIYGLKPRNPFKLIGEQIDGSILLDDQVYLIEARWRQKPTSTDDLFTFQSKVKRKSDFTRGVFISYGGFSEEAIEAFSKGEATKIILLDSSDLYFLLNGYQNEYVVLKDILRIKIRFVAETGRINIPVQEILMKKIYK